MSTRRGTALGAAAAVLVLALAAAACTRGTPLARRSAPPDAGRSGRTATPSASPTVPPRWHVVASPALKPPAALRSVVAVDATHAWAVGDESSVAGQLDSPGIPVVERWNGTAWTRDPLPGITWPGGLILVAADSATDVWTVGVNGPTVDTTVTHVLHNDGTGWREVPYPGNKPSSMLITGLAVVGGHAWLIGNKGSDTVIHEWDGTAWRTHSPPPECQVRGTSFGGMPDFCMFSRITAFAPDDIWVAGNGAWTGFQGASLFHWNGTSWRAVPMTAVNKQLYYFSAVVGRSATDLWAVGNLFNSGTPFVVHGDGTTWHVVDTGVPGMVVKGVAVDAAGAPWLAGYTTTPNGVLATGGAPGTASGASASPGASVTGGALPNAAGPPSAAGSPSAGAPPPAWQVIIAPQPSGTLGASLEAITAVPGTGIMFAVGDADLPTTPRTVTTLIEEYSPPDGGPAAAPASAPASLANPA